MSDAPSDKKGKYSSRASGRESFFFDSAGQFSQFQNRNKSYCLTVSQCNNYVVLPLICIGCFVAQVFLFSPLTVDPYRTLPPVISTTTTEVPNTVRWAEPGEECDNSPDIINQDFSCFVTYQLQMFGFFILTEIVFLSFIQIVLIVQNQLNVLRETVFYKGTDSDSTNFSLMKKMRGSRQSKGRISAENVFKNSPSAMEMDKRENWKKFIKRKLTQRELMNSFKDFSESKAFLIQRIALTIVWCLVYAYITSKLVRPENCVPPPSTAFLDAIGYARQCPWILEDAPSWYIPTERVFLWIVNLDFLLGLIVATEKMKWFLSSSTILDLVTLPVTMMVIDFIFGIRPDDYLKNYGFLRFMRLYGMLPTLQKVAPTASKVKLKIVAITSGVLAIVLTFSGAMFNEEAQVPGAKINTFWEAVYYLVVTISTVGYGDLVPFTMLGRFLAVLSISVVIIFIPDQVRQLTELLAQPPPQIGKLPSKKKDGNFVLVIGDISPDNLDTFTWEMAHASVSHPKNIVLFTMLDPREFKQVISFCLTAYRIRISIRLTEPARGNTWDLAKIKWDMVEAVYLFNSSVTLNPEDFDKMNVLRALLLQKFLPLCDVVSVQNRSFWIDNLMRDLGCEQNVCLHEMKLKMMAKVVGGCCGFNTLMCNLSKTMLSSSSVIPRNFFPWGVKQGKAKRQTFRGFFDYLYGAMFSLYKMFVPISMGFNRKFEELCLVLSHIQTAGRMIPIGVETSDGRILINPRGYLVANGDYLIVIATSGKVVDEAQVLHIDKVPDVKIPTAIKPPKDFIPVGQYSVEYEEEDNNRRSSQRNSLLSMQPSVPVIMDDRRFEADSEADVIAQSPSVPPDTKPVANKGKLRFGDEEEETTPKPTNNLLKPKDSVTRNMSDARNSVIHRIMRKSITAHHSNLDRFVVKQWQEAFAVLGRTGPRYKLVVVCGWPASLPTFLKAIFAAEDGDWINVCVLSPGPPENASLTDLADFVPGVAYINGSPLIRDDLVRAGISQANSVVVFAANHKMANLDADRQMRLQEWLQDTENCAIATDIKVIRRMIDEEELEKPYVEGEPEPKLMGMPLIVTELIDVQHLPMLDTSSWFPAESVRNSLVYLDSPEYVGGRVVSDLMMFPMACRSPLLSDLLVDGALMANYLIDGGRDLLSDPKQWQPYLTLMDLDQDWYKTQFNMQPDPEKPKEKRSERVSFGALFQHMWIKGYILVGLLRARVNKDENGKVMDELGKVEYVFTAPPFPSVVQGTDRLYVIVPPWHQPLRDKIDSACSGLASHDLGSLSSVQD